MLARKCSRDLRKLSITTHLLLSSYEELFISNYLILSIFVTKCYDKTGSDIEVSYNAYDDKRYYKRRESWSIGRYLSVMVERRRFVANCNTFRRRRPLTFCGAASRACLMRGKKTARHTLSTSLSVSVDSQFSCTHLHFLHWKWDKLYVIRRAHITSKIYPYIDQR